MQKLLILFVILIFSGFFNARAQAASAKSHDLPQITILAASSFSEPLIEIARTYSKNNNIIVTSSFDGTAELAKKIEQGEKADIFICAHPFWISQLKQKGLIDVYSLINLVKNRLALVASKKSNLGNSLKSEDSFAKKLAHLNKRTILVMGDFDNSALGFYTKQVIEKTDSNEHTNLWNNLESKIIPSPSAKNALYLIAKGETAGIVYLSDAYNNQELNILSIIDEKLHDPIIYQAAVVAGENMTLARDFLIFLQSEKAKQIYKKHGFVID